MCLNRSCNIPYPEEKFTFFFRTASPFSNWHPSPFQVNGIYYCCSEQFMMAEKARLFNDNETLSKIMATNSPREHKAYGREVKNFDKDKWETVAKDLVYKGCYAKFTQNPDLKKALLATEGTTLVETNPKDPLWGIGLSEDDPRAQDRSTWQGKNWLGEILTSVRDHLIKGM
jgi:ribA/ribD-fused uncharacterized protein